MRLRLIVSMVAGLTVALPVFAQDMPAPTPAVATPAPGAEAAASGIDAAAQTFRAQVEAMNAEVRAVVQAAGSNRRRASSRVEEILARYQPGFESFAVQLEAWFSQRAAAAATEEARASVVQTGAASVARVRGLPDQVRAGLVQQAQARAVPEQPRNTQPSMGY